MRSLISQSRYNSTVKLKGLTVPTVLVGSHEYNSALKLSRVGETPQNVLTAKFAEVTFDKVDCLYYLENSNLGQKLTVTTPTFSLYFINPDYSEVFVASQSGVLTGNGWQNSFLLSSLLPNFIEGQAALKVSVATTRLGIPRRASVYVNHLGVYDSIIRLRNDVDFLDITKLDE